MTKFEKAEEQLWLNPNVSREPNVKYKGQPLTLEAVLHAKERFERFKPYLSLLFPETGGTVQSELKAIDAYQRTLITFLGGRIPGQWYMKCDHALPISGSVKARGGLYALLSYAEQTAMLSGLLDAQRDSTQYHDANMRHLFEGHTIVVGSTGNLGMSIGIISKALGFNVEVHMSIDAKPWKVQRLKALGATVIQHDASYSEAVARGRAHAQAFENAYFIDDEDSLELFLGYAVSAFELKAQLPQIDSTHPLFVYLPCGVGGAPSGIAFALKHLFGDAVHLFTAEPTQAPCIALGLASGQKRNIDVTDIGLTGKTIADGLAVSRGSELAFNVLDQTLSGCYTVSDEKMLRMLYLLHASEGVALEPSALASFIGPAMLFYTHEGFDYLKTHDLLAHAENIIHVSWATGGSMVPEDVMQRDIQHGQASELITF